MQYVLHHLTKDINETVGRVRLRAIRKFRTVLEANEILRQIEVNSTMSYKYVVLECNPLLARSIIINHVRDIYMGTRNYHFLIANLVMSDFYAVDYISELSAINITSIRLERTAKTEMKQFANFVRFYSSNFNRSNLKQGNYSLSINSTVLSVCN